MSSADETPATPPKFDGPFDFASYPADSCFHDRRGGVDRRQGPDSRPAEGERRARKDRRRRIDPTTFEKQYSGDELEFMNAMQRFKVQSGKAFPSYRDVLVVAHALGYRRVEDSSPEAELE